ncbi:hypothetical protein GCM10027416_19000 [Okibacterium endophyticum]
MTEESRARKRMLGWLALLFVQVVVVVACVLFANKPAGWYIAGGSALSAIPVTWQVIRLTTRIGSLRDDGN